MARPRLGLALGADAVTAVVPGRPGSAVTVPLTLPEERDGVARELFRAFHELAGRLGEAGAEARVSVSLLPPLGDVRVVELPPLRSDEAEAVLRRDGGRYFLAGPGPLVVGVAGSGRSAGDGGGVNVLAGAASLAVLHALEVAAEQAGWLIEAVTPAHGPWLHGSRSLKGAPIWSVVALMGETAHVVRVDAENRSSVRQVSRRDGTVLAGALGPGPGRVLVLGSSGQVEEISPALSAAGWVAVRDPGGWGSAAESAAARAGKGPLELVPPALALRRRERSRSATIRLAAVAVLLVLAAGIARLWGAYRELGAVQARRAEIAAQVGPLLQARDSLRGLSERFLTIEGLATRTPRWTPVLVELAGLLPRDTHLTSVYASGDTLELEAAGSRAGEAIQALRDAGLFRDVRLQGIVERELENGETVVERFRVSARLAPSEGADGGDPTAVADAGGRS